MPPSGVDASPKPSPPRPMVDFCSGASFAALNEGKLILNYSDLPWIHGLKVIGLRPNRTNLQRAVRGSLNH